MAALHIVATPNAVARSYTTLLDTTRLGRHGLQVYQWTGGTRARRRRKLS